MPATFLCSVSLQSGDTFFNAHRKLNVLERVAPLLQNGGKMWLIGAGRLVSREAFLDSDFE